MPNIKYVLNSLQSAVIADPNTVAIIIEQERFSIRGHNIALVLTDVLELFSVAKSEREALSLLSDKYSIVPLKKMLHFLIEKRVLIDEDDDIFKNEDNQALLGYSDYDLDVQNVAEKIDSLTLGLIGSSELVNELFSNFSKSRLIKNYSIHTTDNAFVSDTYSEGINIIYNENNPNIEDIGKVIENSDFIIACSDFYNHSLFQAVDKLCIDKNLNWLRLVVDGFNAEVGPLFSQYETACYSCLHSRNRYNMNQEQLLFDDLYLSEKTLKKIPSLVTVSAFNTIAASTTCLEILRYFINGSCNLKNSVLMIDGRDFKTQIDTVWKDYTCPDCWKRSHNE